MNEIMCGRDGCNEASKFMLTCGERCPEHAFEDQPETAEYLAWGKAVLAGVSDE